MNADQVGAQFDEWCRHLPRVEPFYAVKCNNNPVLMRVLASLGCGFDCASKGEIESVLNIPGVGPERIIYANPCKTRSHIRHARSRGVTTMTFDNEEELEKLSTLFPHAQLILRIAVSDPTAICPLNVKFGCEIGPAADGLLRRAAELQMKIVGISFHVGSGCQDPSAFSDGIKEARRLFRVGKEEFGHDLHILDIGGGFPGHATPQITFQQIAHEVNAALERDFPLGGDGVEGVRVVAEPGRFFASAAFSLVCNIIAKTRVSGERIDKEGEGEEGCMYYINDGVYGSFNCILYDHVLPSGAPLMGGGREMLSSVWGPTCDGLDLVLPSARIPEMGEGDWMIFNNMGAYTLAAGSEFNGFPRPTIVYTGSAAALAGALECSVDDEVVDSVESVCSSDETTVSSAASSPDETDQEE
jgi:ornithine decarboxylase